MEETETDSVIDIFIEKHKVGITVFLLLAIISGLGVLYLKKKTDTDSSDLVLSESTTAPQNSQIIVEIVGQIKSPGVYKMDNTKRVEDLLMASGGLTQNADTKWIEKNLNRAALLSDGQKIFIPSVDEQLEGSSAKNRVVYQSDTQTENSLSEGKTNINSATLSELDKLPGIGPVYGQKIIDQRPYSNIEDLIKKDVIPQKTYESIKDLIIVF